MVAGEKIMSISHRGQELHHRAASGEILSQQERNELDLWYSEMDADEESMLHRTARTEPNVPELREHLQARLAELEGLVSASLEIESRNESLRREIGQLKKRLVDEGILAA
jgi:hypothetical protein